MSVLYCLILRDIQGTIKGQWMTVIFCKVMKCLSKLMILIAVDGSVFWQKSLLFFLWNALITFTLIFMRFWGRITWIQLWQNDLFEFYVFRLLHVHVGGNFCVPCYAFLFSVSNEAEEMNENFPDQMLWSTFPFKG